MRSAGGPRGWPLDAGTARSSLSISLRFGSFALPSEVAERLPKALIHHNVPGERIHRYLQAHGPGVAGGGAAGLVRQPAALDGHVHGHCSTPDGRCLDGPSRWRLGEVTVAGKPWRRQLSA